MSIFEAHLHGLSGKRVLCLSPPDVELSEELEGASVDVGAPTGSGLSVPDNEKYDLVIADTRCAEIDNHVTFIQALADRLPGLLANNGIALTVIKTGKVQSDWDVSNSILATPMGPMPSSPYLFDELLSAYSIRPLLRLSDESDKAYAVTRLFRLTPRKPILLLVAGASQSGKTTLVRAMGGHRAHRHLSNDYLFYELFQLSKAGASDELTRALTRAIDGGGFEDAGAFFRKLDDDEDLLRAYLQFLVLHLPMGEDIVSMDIDLRVAERIEFLKQFFSENGYSVWVASRWDTASADPEQGA